MNNAFDQALNGIPLINGEEYSWGHIKTCINGVPVTGIVAISYGDKQDIQNNYGAGRYPVSQSKGRITPSAKITLYMSEVVSLVANAPNHRLQDIAPFNIEVAYLPENGMVVVTRFATAALQKTNATGKRETSTSRWNSNSCPRTSTSAQPAVYKQQVTN